MKTILILAILGIFTSCASHRGSDCQSKENCSKQKCEKEKCSKSHRNHMREFSPADRLR